MPKEPAAAGRMWERRCRLNGELGFMKQQGLLGDRRQHPRQSGGLTSRH